MPQEPTDHSIRQALLTELRSMPTARPRDPLQPGADRSILTYDLARQLALKYPSWPKDEIWRHIQELIVQGVLLMGHSQGIDDPHKGGQPDMWRLPFCTISSYGVAFLDSTKDDPDPYDAVSLLEPLRDRNIANNTVEAYVPEAVLSLRAGAFRGACILVGVAAEAISEDIYEAFIQHLSSSKSQQFETELQKKKTSAEGRWKAFTSRFPQGHEACIGDELNRRFSSVLDPQLKTFKQNRDDAAHRRATLINKGSAQAALAMLVPFGITAADVITALQAPCRC